MSKNAKKPRYVKTLVPLSGDKLPVYAGTRFSIALHEVMGALDVYQGAKLTVVLEGIYQQGKKDGARTVEESFVKMMKQIPHLNPGKRKK